MTDEALGARLIAGDQRAFNQLMRRWRDRVVDFAHLLTGDRDAAEDIGQEAFVRLLRRPDAYDPRRPFASWILAVTRHLCYDRHRRDRTRARHQERARPPRALPSPPDAAAAAEQEEVLRREVAALPPQFRDAYVLCAVRGFSYEEAARVCGCPEKTISTRLARARGRLLERMKRWL